MFIEITRHKPAHNIFAASSEGAPVKVILLPGLSYNSLHAHYAEVTSEHLGLHLTDPDVGLHNSFVLGM